MSTYYAGNKPIKFIEDRLIEREKTFRLRELRVVLSNGIELAVNGKRLINFSSNDYLGLAENPLLKERAKLYIDQYGVGSCSSRLVSGNHPYHEAIEAKIAKLVGTQSALLFCSGYQANSTVIPALADPHALIIADKHIHQSLVAGALASRAKFLRYRHNDLDHLKTLLSKTAHSTYSRRWIVTESIFSMDGDQSDLDALITLARSYGAFLYVDDAHAFGVMGNKGMGLCAGKQGIDVIMSAFGKAGGAAGAFIACSQQMRQYLIQFCGGLIYSTAPSPPLVGAMDAALDLIPLLDKERFRLHENAARLRTAMRQMGFEIGTSTAHIIPWIVGSEQEVLELSKKLEQNGFFVIAIRPPTVGVNRCCLRFSLSALHTQEHLDCLIELLRTIVE